MEKPYKKEEMLYWYSTLTALKLVHNLSQAGAGLAAYDAAAQILMDAANDKAAGLDPEKRIRDVHGGADQNHNPGK